MRITAGEMRGRTMKVPEIEDLRPTASRVREALFNIIGDVHEMSILDLFSGSGVIGIEALSRGAGQVLSIEGSRAACQAMMAVREAWNIESWTIQAGKLPQALPSNKHFEVVFADPPYGKGLAEQVPGWLEKAGVTYDLLVVEEASRTVMKWKKGVVPSKQRKYGESTLYFFEPEEDVA
jgi:16S rRNA (guanine966-N2)-methyltransferase